MIKHEMEAMSKVNIFCTDGHSSS